MVWSARSVETTARPRSAWPSTAASCRLVIGVMGMLKFIDPAVDAISFASHELG